MRRFTTRHGSHVAGDPRGDRKGPRGGEADAGPTRAGAWNPPRRRDSPMIIGVWHGGRGTVSLIRDGGLITILPCGLLRFAPAWPKPAARFCVSTSMRQDRPLSADDRDPQGESKLSSYAAASGVVAGLLALWTLLIHVLA